MSSGHDGSISTGHSGSPEEMLSRLETMVLMGTDIPLLAIRKLSEAANYMAGTAEVEGRLVPTGHSLVRRKKLEAAALALGAGL